MTPEQLLLVRHGETDWNRNRRVQGHTDIPLNENGRRQAEALAARLTGRRVDALHSSDLGRAVETARTLGRALGLDPVLSPDWREINLGALEGALGDEVRKSFHEPVSHAADTGLPIAEGGDTYAELRDRLVRGFERLCRDHAGETVCVVSHGGALKALIAHLIGLPPERIDRLSLRGNTSLSIVEFGHGRPQLTLLNDTRHLP